MMPRGKKTRQTVVRPLQQYKMPGMNKYSAVLEYFFCTSSEVDYCG